MLLFLGLGCLSVAFFATVIYASNPSEDVPRWVSALCAFMLFTYQTLDAIDGKQARRTKAGSPLGQLFDHGCDSVGTVLIMYFQAVCCRIGYNMYTIFSMFAVMIPFFLAQWEEHHTHKLRTFVGWIGVTEGQWAGILLLSASAILGSDFYVVPLSSIYPALPSLQITQALTLTMCLSNLTVALNNIATVVYHEETGPKSPWFGAWTLTSTKVFAPLLDLVPLSVLTASSVWLRSL
jgi:phosphatidylglycerophosphate synthase